MPTLSFFQLLILLLLAFLLFGDIAKLKERIKHSLGDDKSTKDSKIKQKKILDHLQGEIKKEVKYGKNSRVDIFITNPKGKDCFIEVKSVTLSRIKGLAEFPDAKTTRGSKHLIELGEMSKQGNDCYLVYLIQRKDINIFSIAKLHKSSSSVTLL